MAEILFVRALTQLLNLDVPFELFTFMASDERSAISQVKLSIFFFWGEILKDPEDYTSLSF